MRSVGFLLLICTFLATPSRGQAEEPARRLWAVLVGVENYPEPIPDCPDSRGNVEALDAWLRKTQASGWVDRGVLRVVDRGTESLTSEARIKPTSANLSRTVRTWLEGRGLRKNDVILFYFSGHAFARPADPARKETAPTARLLPSDVNPLAPDQLGVSLPELFDGPAFRDCQVVIWLDTSLKGHGPKGWSPPSLVDFQTDSRRFLASLVDRPGRTAWIAADGVPSGVTGEGRAARGQFTSALLAALGPATPIVPNDTSGLMASLAAVGNDRELARQGFSALGKFPPGLGLRRDELARPINAPAPELIVQRGHNDAVTALALMPDSSTLITASADSTVKFWDLRDLSLLRTQTGHLVGVNALAISPDGGSVASGDGQGMIQVRDLARSLPRRSSRSRGKAIAQILAVPTSSPPRFVGRDLDGRGLTWIAPGVDVRPTALAEGPDEGTGTAITLAVAAEPSSGGPAIAALGSAGTIRLFDAVGKLLATREGLRPQADEPLERGFLALSHDGTIAVAATKDGQLVKVSTRDKADRAEAPDLPKFEGITGIAVSRAGLLAVLSDGPDEAIKLVSLNDCRLVKTLPGSYRRLAWSSDGRTLAAARIDGDAGRVDAWRVDDAGQIEPIALAFPDGHTRETLVGAGVPSALLITNGRLIAGTNEGRVLSWSLPASGGPPTAAWGFAIEPGRGQILHISAHPGRPVVLAVDRLRRAWTWDLTRDGPSSIEGRWTSGTLLSDGSMALTGALDLDAAPGIAGEIALFDPANQKLPVSFTKPGNEPATWALIASDPTGTWIAASSSDGHGESGDPTVRAAVWSVKGGAPLHTFEDSPEIGEVVALAFSKDGKRLLLVHRGDDQTPGRATLHDLEKPGAAVMHTQPFLLPEPTNGDLVPMASAAAIDPTDPDRFVLGGNDGRIWEADLKAPGKLILLAAPLARRPVTGLGYSPDGKHLVVGFEDTPILLLARINGKFRVEPNLDWRHDERVNAVSSIQNGRQALFVTAADDGCLKLWEPSTKKKPVGTLASWSGAPTSPRWLVFTPDGAFDGTIEGTKFVRRVGARVETLEQAIDRAHVPGLARRLVEGEAVTLNDRPWPDAASPPALTIEGPSTAGRQAEVRLKFDADADPASLRLYHNGQPIALIAPDGSEIERPDPAGTSIRVTLTRGDNTLYAMASRPGATDGRSADLALFSTARQETGRLHVLSLGVANYNRRRLKYATADAQAMADRLKQADAEGQAQLGLVRVLTDEQVNAKTIHDFFRELSEQTRNRPEDRVVVFLAGHTAVAEGEDAPFCLLRTDYPFETDWPANALALRDGEVDRLPAARARAHAISFSQIYTDLGRITPLNRLVIVDGCSAQSILRDAAVRRLQDRFSHANLSARVAYVLGSRSGAPSYEDDELKHGLLTYCLLRGTGAEGLNSHKEEVENVFLPFQNGANLNGDDTTTTDELQTFADRTVTPLVSMALKDAPRGTPGEPPPDPGPRPMMARRTTGSFPLLTKPPR